MSPERARAIASASSRWRSVTLPDDIKKMKTKSHLLCPWVARDRRGPAHPRRLEDLIGPDLRCWSMAWRVKNGRWADLAGWHQDLAYGAAVPVVLGAWRCRTAASIRAASRGIPGSHTWGILKHEESDDFDGASWPAASTSLDAFDESEGAWTSCSSQARWPCSTNSLVHGSGTNCRARPPLPAAGRDAADWAKPPRDPPVGTARPAAATPTATSTTSRGPTASSPRPRSPDWAGVVNKRAKLIFEDSRYGPSEAYGGRRPAT